jgi:hypothetical protein
MPRGINEVENVVLAFIFVIHSANQKVVNFAHFYIIFRA